MGYHSGMDELKIEIGSNLKELKKNAASVLPTLEEFSQEMQKIKERAAELQQQAKDIEYIDPAKVRQLQEKAHRLQRDGSVMQQIWKEAREEIEKTLAGGYNQDPRSARNAIKSVNNKLSDSVTEGDAVRLGVDKLEQELTILQKIQTERNANVESLNKNADAYEKLGDAYLQASIKNEELATSLRRQAEIERQDGAEGTKRAMQLEKMADALDKETQIYDARSEALNRAAVEERKVAETTKKQTISREELVKHESKANAAMMKHSRELQKASDAYIITENNAQKYVSVQEKVTQTSIKNAEKTEAEDAVYRLLGKSIFQVAAELERLKKQRAEASRNGELETVRKLDKQIIAYQHSLWKLRMERQVHGIQLTQQASLVHHVSGNIKSLGTQVMNLQKNMKEGSLDINAFTQTVISLSYAIKTGLGPLGWFMLAVEGIAMAWNAYAKSQEEARKKLEEMSKEAENARNAIADSYTDMAKAVSSYNREQENAIKTKEALQYYKDLNWQVGEQTRLLNEAAAAELHRIAITTQGDEHKEAMERLSLQNKLNAGLVTQAEYEKRLIELDEKKANRAADAAIAQKKVAADTAIAAAKEAENAAEAAKYAPKTSMAGLTESAEVVKTREKQIQSLLKNLKDFDPKKLAEAESKVREIDNLLAVIDKDGKRDDDVIQSAKAEKKELQSYLDSYSETAQELMRLAALQPEYAREHGAEEYAKMQKERQSRLDSEMKEVERLDDEAFKARVAADKATKEVEKAEQDAARTRKQNADTRKAREEAIAIRENEARKNADREEKNSKLRERVQQIEKKDLNRALDYVRGQLERTDARIASENNEKERKRLESKKKTLLDLEKNLISQQENLIRQADSVLGTERGQLAAGDKRGTSAKLMGRLEEQLQKALATPETSDDELLLRLIEVTKPAVEEAARNQHRLARIERIIADLERKTKNLNR